MSFLRGNDSKNIRSAGLQEERGPLLTPEMQFALAFVVVLVLGLLCGLTTLPGMLSNDDVQTQDVQQADFSLPTAREGVAAAIEFIREEDPGARLAGGGTVWYPVLNTTQVGTGRNTWTFFFYLPATAEMATVIVDNAGTPSIKEVVDWENPPPLLDAQLWRIDSPEVASHFAANCAEALDNALETSVEFRLVMALEARNVVWVAQTADSSGISCEIAVDAVTGLLRN